MSNILIQEVINVSDFSKIANITEQYARFLIRQGKVPATKVGKEYRLKKVDVYEFLNIKTDINKVEEQMKISKLESEIQIYKSKLNVLKDMIKTIETLVEFNN